MGQFYDMLQQKNFGNFEVNRRVEFDNPEYSYTTNTDKFIENWYDSDWTRWYPHNLDAAHVVKDCYRISVAPCQYQVDDGVNTFEEIAATCEHTGNAAQLRQTNINVDVDLEGKLSDEDVIFTGRMYEMKGHDTLERVATRFGVTKDDLANTNYNIDELEANGRQVCIVPNVCLTNG